MKHFISSLSVLCANTPPCKGRVSSRKILSLLLILFLGIGNAWAEELEVIETLNLSASKTINETPITVGDVLSITGTKGTNNFPVFNYNANSGTDLRFYKGNSCSVKFTAKEGYKLEKIVFKKNETTVSELSNLSVDNGTLTDNEWTASGSSESVTFTYNHEENFNKQIYKIYVTYSSTSSGGDEPVASLAVNPTTIDFGTVYEGATVADKTITVNFANLIGDVTYSGLSTPFTATGAISATGDKITISADASTIGEYSQTLTVASTADSKTAEVTVKMNVEEKPAPTGTFTLHTGELIEGDYVIYYSGKAMKAEVASNRLQYVEVTPSNDEIVDPAAAAIWHIAKSGDNWIVYNNNAGYAAGTGTKSQADLVANLTGDNANKAAWTVTASDNAYEFVNVWNKSKSVNANLRNNTTYGFACYTTSTGGALSLYRKAGTKYNVTVSSTTNGSVTASPTSAEAGATIALTVTPDAGYVLDALTVTDASSNTIEVADNKFTMPAADVTIAATFKENEKPDATLTLSKNGVEETFPGSWKQDDVVTLPSITSDCVKEFVGWSANPTCNVAPEYAAGDSYTLAATAQTLYAVYATVGGGGETTASNTLSSNGWTNESKHTSLQIDANVKAAVTGGGNTGKYYTSGTNWRLYQNENPNLTISTTIGELKSITFTFAVENTGTFLCGGTKLTSGNAVSVSGTSATFTVGNSSADVTNGQIRISKIEVVYTGGVSYSNYSTTCAAAPKAEVNPTTVSATAAGANDKVEVTYENVNTESVAVALFNDEACTEAFTADWLTASLDGDKNITYTVAATTLYTERKAYIKLTAPETTGATEPAVVVIPVTQAAKDKVFASLAELVAADLTAGDEVTVTLNNDVIKEFYIYNSKRAGVVFDVQKDGKDIKIYFDNQTTIDNWVVGGKLSGTLTNVKWTTYSSAWQLAPANTWAWANLTYTEPKAVSTVVISGAPTKTTYVDGEAFNPAGLTVTVNYNDATSEVNPTGVTFDVTPATLTKGETSVSVTATYNSVSSAAYEVTGLTVNDIPTKTVAEFIAAEGGRCYLEGIVSGLTEGNSMKYGNFDLTDASGTIYVYGCLNASGEAQKFASLGVKAGDKIKVIADEYELYGGTKDEAINVQYVSHISAATITIADITMEVEEVKTISATVEPAEAVVTYTIKENTANAISLSGNVITANAVGTATITATIATAAEYMGNSVDFTVTVNPQNIAVLPFEFDKGKTDIASTLGMSQEGLGSDYSASTAPNSQLKFDNTGDWAVIRFDSEPGELSYNIKNNSFSGGTFSVQESADGETYTDVKVHTEITETQNEKHTLLSTSRYVKFIYTTKSSGNVGLGNIKITKLSVLRADLYDGKWGTFCPDQKVTYMQGASFYTLTYLEMKDGMPYKLFFDEITTDYLEAGKPYLFIAEGEEIKGVKSGEVVSIASNYNGFYGNVSGNTISLTTTQTEYVADGDVVNNYGVINSRFTLLGNGTNVAHERAHVQIKNGQLDCPNPPASLPALAPGARRVVAGATGINTATGVDQVQGDNVPTKMIINGQLFILRGEKMYDAQGKLVK